jgi:hypothetical protein
MSCEGCAAFCVQACQSDAKPGRAVVAGSGAFPFCPTARPGQAGAVAHPIVLVLVQHLAGRAEYLACLRTPRRLRHTLDKPLFGSSAMTGDSSQRVSRHTTALAVCM